jgi:hypothetical protein
MVRKHALRPQVDGCLEQRLALSALGTAPAGTALVQSAGSVSVQARHLTLVGLIQGSNQSAGPGQTFSGSGPIAPLGNVSVSGQFGVDRAGRQQDFLVLTTAHGKVRLKLTPAGSNYQFTIVAATGAYRGLTGKGSAIFEFGGPLLFVRPGVIQGYFAVALNEPFPPIAIPA